MLTLDLNPQKSPQDTKVVVAMSGGVDSSTAAALLYKSGYNVIGITLQLFDYGLAVGKRGTCCAGQDIYDAKIVSEKFGFPHFVLNYESKFRESVIDDFVDSYVRGETPLPCVRCNQSVKFKDLMKVAQDLDADALVTGHYARRIDGLHGPELHKGIDANKDQSYFLFATTREQLQYIHFPLGAMTKEETRLHAADMGLSIADKPDSQDICFVPNGKYADVLHKLRPDIGRSAGDLIHVDGFKLGEHDGIINYTIGQRRGLGVAFAHPLYVIKIDPNSNTVFVGEERHLMKQAFKIKDINWLAPDIDLLADCEFTIKIRSGHGGSIASISSIDDDMLSVVVSTPEKSITPGQACVIYRDTRLIGGGWITRD